ncbi:Clg1p KNAG_0B00540 [Huiozyma naganishii CBS 8797]|uniref:Uncharacterized protein n=1 Tax=Huiozyma naganishii (strain ATCC MYA-139 / BCRC 22969 / CBS 8797 / KCTC 17520 / NBRC 10181 / NCYC 3082 / Yp74L-3) TaxID=1071383 RepID=J7RUK5_HUIN7|nr:hypothetical protein KNAG_0B00540 [Kazachstania naganishii CBS 8797]CCK68502.1 hypothetical protein KNAG_0B00540 [Kazachstania naganishii CBS 8797]
MIQHVGTGIPPVLHEYYPHNVQAQHQYSDPAHVLPLPKPQYYNRCVNNASYQHPGSYHSTAVPHQQPTILPPPGMSYTGQMGLPVQLPLPRQQSPLAFSQPVAAAAAAGAPPTVLVQVPTTTMPATFPNEKVNGGVSQVLDYNIDIMSEYVVKSAYIAFGQKFDLEGPQRATDLLFVKSIKSVLNATRLPSVSIFLSLDFLFKYLQKDPEAFRHGDDLDTIMQGAYQNVILGFVLANKFNDDKTFTNSSWSQASSLELSVINQLERHWLEVFEWDLYDDRFQYYEDFAHSFDVFVLEKQQQQQQQQKQQQSASQSSTPMLSGAPSENIQFCSSPITPVFSSTFDETFNVECNNNYSLINIVDYPYYNVSSPVMATMKDNDFSNVNGFNYDFYNFSSAYAAPAPAPPLPRVIPAPMQHQHAAPAQAPVSVPTLHFNYNNNPTWNNTDLTNFHVSSMRNNTSYSAVC